MYTYCGQQIKKKLAVEDINVEVLKLKAYLVIITKLFNISMKIWYD